MIFEIAKEEDVRCDSWDPRYVAVPEVQAGVNVTVSPDLAAADAVRKSHLAKVSCIRTLLHDIHRRQVANIECCSHHIMPHLALVHQPRADFYQPHAVLHPEELRRQVELRAGRPLL